MTLEDIIQEIEDIKQDATEMLIDMHRKKVPQNSYRVGYEKGIQDICKELLEKINGIIGVKNDRRRTNRRIEKVPFQS
jgi:hypothetical protein